MKYDEVTTTITKLCKDQSLNFAARIKSIQDQFEGSSAENIIEHLLTAGCIPECFSHDSTEEKLHAIYCDTLLLRSLNELGLQANAIPGRSDAADVEGSGDNYRIVADAKAFRLSRTAKNQKDFKVEALDKWRKGADFACLVSPLYQYPNKNSQIYIQAIRFNVTLISYTHLAFMITNANNIKKDGRLRELWEVGRGLKIGKSAVDYWHAVDRKMIDLSHSSESEWQKVMDITFNKLPEQARKQIEYWEEVKKDISRLSHDAAVEKVIQALKINDRIKVIKRTAGIR